MEDNNRIEYIDIAKGIGILLVVLGHVQSQFHVDLHQAFPILSLFHVPLFFFLSGVFYSETSQLIPFVEKKFVRLFIPYLLVNVVFFVLEAYYDGLLFDRVDWNQLSFAILGLQPVHNSLSGPTWFLLVLFRVSVLYKLIQIVSKGNAYIMMLISLSLSVFGLISSWNFFFLRQTFVALSFFSIGHVMKRIIRDHDWHKRFQIIILPLMILALVVLSFYQFTDMSVNMYSNKWLFLIGSVMGIFTTLVLSGIIDSSFKALKFFFTFIGRNSLPILMWHMFFMKVVFTVLGKYVSNGLTISFIAIIVAVFLSCVVRQIYVSAKNFLWSR